MPPLVIPDALLVAASGSNQGTSWTNVFGVALGSPVEMDQGKANEIGQCVRDMYDVMHTLFTDEWSLDGCAVYDIQSAGNPAFDSVMEPLYGTGTGSNMPPHMAACASHKTNRRGKSYRGRTYFCGWAVNNSMTTDGKVSGAVSTAIINACDGFRADLLALASIDAAFAVVSRTLHVATAIVSTTCGAEFDHQDRRKRSE